MYVERRERDVVATWILARRFYRRGLIYLRSACYLETESPADYPNHVSRRVCGRGPDFHSHERTAGSTFEADPGLASYAFSYYGVVRVWRLTPSVSKIELPVFRPAFVSHGIATRPCCV